MATRLDALAAEHVMRWDALRPEWSPSTRIADSMDVVRALNEWREDYTTRRGGAAQKTEGLLELEQSGPRKWHARFLWLQPAHVCDEAGWGETPSLAITLAALRSVGVDEDLIEAAEEGDK